MDITFKIDTTGLNRALEQAMAWTRRTPAEVVNTAAYFIVVGAQGRTASASGADIDSDLAVIKTPVIGKRGKPTKKTRFTSQPGTAMVKGVPLAVLIIQARGRGGSNYNELTHYRWALFGSPFKGISRAQGQAVMAELVHEMIASRHRSQQFLRAGWSNAIATLAPLAVAKYTRSNGGRRVSGVRDFGAQLGDAKPAQYGEVVATCVIENLVGLEGVNGVSHNDALIKYGGPALQAAVDNEGRNAMDYALRKAGEELERNFNKR